MYAGAETEVNRFNVRMAEPCFMTGKKTVNEFHTYVARHAHYPKNVVSTVSFCFRSSACVYDTKRVDEGRDYKIQTSCRSGAHLRTMCGKNWIQR